MLVLSAVFVRDIGLVQIRINDHQKKPYAVNAVAPKVFPFLNSMMPAIICAAPPNAKPIAMITMDKGIKPALCRFNRQVVIPNPRRPRGPGFAMDDCVDCVDINC